MKELEGRTVYVPRSWRVKALMKMMGQERSNDFTSLICVLQKDIQK